MAEQGGKPKKTATVKKAETRKKAETVKNPATPKAATVVAEALKEAKPKAPAKPRKAAAQKRIVATVTSIDINREPVAATVSVMGMSQEQIARLAHQYWLERGCAHGHDAEDWFRAEQELRSKAS